MRKIPFAAQSERQDKMGRAARFFLLLDFFVEEIEVILSLDQSRRKIDGILSRHRRWRRAFGLERRNAACIVLDGGVTSICQLCHKDVASEKWGDHLKNDHRIY